MATGRRRLGIGGGSSVSAPSMTPAPVSTSAPTPLPPMEFVEPPVVMLPAVPAVPAVPVSPVPTTTLDDRHVGSAAAGAMVNKNIMPGVGGAVPPPGAPHEVSQPLSADAGGVVYVDPTTKEIIGMMTPAERAARNEKTLEPLTYGRDASGGGDGSPVSTPVPAIVPHLDPFYARIAEKQAAESASASARPDPTRLEPPAPLNTTTAAEDLSAMPAASNSDSPSRGVPRDITDPGKKITGGFGESSLQYFPLAGDELREVILGLMDQLAARLQNDLRFHLAITYPRVSARVVIEVDAFAQPDAGMRIEAVMPARSVLEPGGTPIEEARTFADHVAFVIIEAHQEVDSSGESITPPDAARKSLGLEIPRKQLIRTADGRQSFADVVLSRPSA